MKAFACLPLLMMTALACAGTTLGENTTPQGKQHWCDNAQIHMCLALADDYEHGRNGVAVDPVRAGELYAKACRAKVPSGCVNLGVIQARAGAIDDAAENFRRACDMEGRRTRAVAETRQTPPLYRVGAGGRLEKNEEVTEAQVVGCVDRAVVKQDRAQLANLCAEGVAIACDQTDVVGILVQR